MDQGTSDINQIIDSLFAEVKQRNRHHGLIPLLDAYNDLIIGRVEKNPAIAVPTESIEKVENLIDSRIHAMIVEKLDKI